METACKRLLSVQEFALTGNPIDSLSNTLTIIHARNRRKKIAARIAAKQPAAGSGTVDGGRLKFALEADQ